MTLHGPSSELNPHRDDERIRQEIIARIESLQRRSWRGLLSLALFLGVSILAQNDFAIFPPLSPEFRSLLGHPPSNGMISAALVLYSFSAILLILSHMVGGIEKYAGLQHVGYLTGFYLFYHFAGKLDDNFWAVLAAGLTILSLDAYHRWTLSSERIREERERLSLMERREKSGL